jgi:glycosyltransferase involved in cell wall biosynthesis
VKRLLFVSPVGFVGGAERVLLECLRQTRQLRPEWELHVLMLSDGPLRQAVQEQGISIENLSIPGFLSQQGDSRLIKNPIALSKETASSSFVSRGRSMLSLPARLSSSLSFFLHLRRAIKGFQPDLIHSNGLKSHLLVAAAKPRSVKLLWHLHDFYSHRPKIQNWLRRAAKRSSGGLAISESVSQDTAKILPGWPLHLVENAVDPEVFSPGATDTVRLDAQAGLSNDYSGLRIGMIATYANWKGQDVFLKAIAKTPDIRGYVIGGPIYHTTGSQWSVDELRSLAKSLRIDDRIGFVPFQSDPTWIYRSLDVVAHTSTRPEPFGLTIIEGMACGRAVIVSDAGGAHDLFRDGHDALGHIPGDVASLASAMRRLVADHNLREQLGHHARQTAVERYSLARFGCELIRAFESTMTAGPASLSKAAP